MKIKHPFIQFFQPDDGKYIFDNMEVESCDCSNIVLPVGLERDIVLPIRNQSIENISYESLSGVGLKKAENIEYNNSVIFNATTAQLTDDLSTFLAKGDCFRLRLEFITGFFVFSNTFMYIGCEVKNTLLFEYWQRENEYFRTRLFAALNNPNPQTDKEEYTDANSFVHTIRKQRRKQLELEFSFYPESVHGSIQEMLTFPSLQIDDTRYFESGDYRIDWENQDENGFAKASTQLSEQEVIRFSNC